MRSFTLSRDKIKRDVFAQKAIETIKEQYNAATMTRQIEKIYTRLTEKKLVH